MERLLRINIRQWLENVITLTPLIFVVVGIMSFTIFGLFEGQYYFSVTSEVIKSNWLAAIFSVGFPIVIELGQFAFMMAAVSNVVNRKKAAWDWKNPDMNIIYSVLGLIATGFMVYFKLSELDNMVNFWKSGENTIYIKSALKAMIIIGLIFEVRIMMLLPKV